MRLVFLLLSLCFSITVPASEGMASAQRGAKLYMQNCLGCHSMEYQRYQSVKDDLAFNDEDFSQFIKVLPDTNDTDFIMSPLSDDAAKQGFATRVPDLSLIARTKGTDWLTAYLMGFYHDSSRPLGVNNLVVPNVNMPNILETLQGVQEPIYSDDNKVIGVQLKSKGVMTEEEYQQVVADLVAFMDYSSDPRQFDRYKLGAWVLGFLLILFILLYLLQKEYWKDVSSKKN